MHHAPINRIISPNHYQTMQNRPPHLQATKIPVWNGWIVIDKSLEWFPHSAGKFIDTSCTPTPNTTSSKLTDILLRDSHSNLVLGEYLTESTFCSRGVLAMGLPLGGREGEEGRAWESVLQRSWISVLNSLWCQRRMWFFSSTCSS